MNNSSDMNICETNESMNKKRSTYVMYMSWMPAIMHLSDSQAGQLIKAIYTRVSGDTNMIPKNPIVAALFMLIAQKIDEDGAKYLETQQKRGKAGKLGGRPKGSIKKAKKANVFFEKQNNPDNEYESVSVSDNESVSDNVSDNDSENVSVSENEYDTSSTEDNSSTDRVVEDAVEIAHQFNAICVDLPQVKAISSKRQALITERLRSYSLADFVKVFTKVNNSPFLCGDNENHWKADFDWILSEEHFLKILEGFYDPRNTKKNTGNGDNTILSIMKGGIV